MEILPVVESIIVYFLSLHLGEIWQRKLKSGVFKVTFEVLQNYNCSNLEKKLKTKAYRWIYIFLVKIFNI